MKRGQPLKRRKQLAHGKRTWAGGKLNKTSYLGEYCHAGIEELQASGQAELAEQYRARIGMKRNQRLKPVGAVAMRQRPALDEFRSATLRRARGICERCGRKRDELECHHLVNRARAMGWPHLHNAEVNGLAACHDCHMYLTLSPHFGGNNARCQQRIDAAFRSFECWRCNDRIPDEKVHPA